MEVSKLEILSPKIVLCNSFLYTNNIQKHYSVSRCVISIIIVIAPTHTKKVESAILVFKLLGMDIIQHGLNILLQ